MNINEKICFAILPGFAVSSMPVTPVENYIRSKGYLVYSSNYWGDGKVEDFSKLSVEDCIEGIHAFIQSVKTKTDYKVIGLGVSLGGALYIEYAKKYNDLDYIVSIGTPFKLKNRVIISIAGFILPFFKYFWRNSPGMVILNSSTMVLDFFKGPLLLDLDKIKTPILFLHSKQDNITYFSALMKNIPKFVNARTHLVVFENKDHVINYDAKAILFCISESIDMIKEEV
jgi:esterase/lipase